MDVAYAFLNHHHSIWINGEQFCIWHSYFTDNMQNLFTYTHIDCLIYRKGEKITQKTPLSSERALNLKRKTWFN